MEIKRIADPNSDRLFLLKLHDRFKRNGKWSSPGLSSQEFERLLNLAIKGVDMGEDAYTDKAVINSDGTVTVKVTTFGVPSPMDGNIYQISQEVLDSYLESAVGKDAGEFGHPAAQKDGSVTDWIDRLSVVDWTNSIGIVVDTDITIGEPSTITIDPSARFLAMIKEGLPVRLGCRSIINNWEIRADEPPVHDITKLMFFDLIVP